ncbi:type I polyketide synthase [Streptomyces morookaense]|uniref:SDR family oxidoreductase n=1 Tax=Streptomyces morookaense TaxID=1970 RepID=A0A7Y7BAF3_STRMO|nr:type I polyketide synthase [Streptomyces morookaense]NVK81789.1 SDR family oxidoreductase [Streptomyces morookaense]GHF09087.1 polyketide synthase [Streptomyces morookaense]
MPDTPPAERVPVAVTGLGALLPDARDVEQSWRLILGRHDAMTGIPPSRWLVDDYYDPEPGTPGKVYVRRGAFLPRVDFEPLAHGIPPSVLASTDTAQLLALMVADQVLHDATGGRPQDLDRERVSVIIGSGALEMLTQSGHRNGRPLWLSALREQGLPEHQAQALCDAIAARCPEPDEMTFPGGLGNLVAGRIANRFDLHGTNHTTDAACASSLAALSCALDELALGRADLVLAGGVDASNDIGTFRCFTTTPALSPTGDCRPFSADADGTMLGEALALFALKRLADAERDGDRIYAVIRGLGTSSDGRGTAIYAPLAEGQARALRRAYADAGYAPGTVGLVEAHGTGTRAGDQAEFGALREVYEAGGRPGVQWCALGSVKSQIGHTKCAAGAVGLLKAVLALHHKVLPPTIKADRPHPDLHIGTSPFYLNTAARPWIRPAGHPRRAAVSSFGFGGSNFHTTLEEAPPGAPRPPRARTHPTELLLLSGASADELRERIAAAHAAADAGRTDDGFRIADLARHSQEAFRATDPLRLAVIAADAEELAARLDRAAAHLATAGERQHLSERGELYCTAGAPGTGRIAFLFPGQGSQYPGMGADLAVHEPAAQAAWDAVAGEDAAEPPLHRVVFPPPAADDAARVAQQALLTETRWAQPALAAHSVALLAVLREHGLRPDCTAGHSLGELTALYAAGAYDAGTLLQLARRRGASMHDAAADAPGGMAAVAAGPEETAELIGGAGNGLWIANHNGPSQTVLSGTAQALAAATARLDAAGVAVTPLPAAAAFHSPLVAAARAPFEEALRTAAVRAPEAEVYSNTDAAPYPPDPEAVRARLAAHLTAPVRFADQIEAMYAAGVRVFAEVGAGSVLTRLTGHILGDRPHLAVSFDHRDGHGVTALQDGLARLAVHGVPLDPGPSWRHYRPPAEPEQEQRTTMTVKIDGGNHGRTYPPQAADSTPAGSTPAPAETAPPPVSVPDVTPVAPAGAPEAVVRLIEDAQRQTAEAHAAYQRMMTESHLAFLKLSEASFAALLGDAPAGVLPQLPDTQAPFLSAQPVETGAPPPTRQAVEMPAAPPAAEPVVVPDVPPESGPDAGQPTEQQDIGAVLLSVVAERTGYPVEMLRLDMELEADLGIDSIKKVEILSALRRHLGELPQGDPAELVVLRTLGQIADRIRTLADTTGSPPPTGPVPLDAEPAPLGELPPSDGDIGETAAPPPPVPAATVHTARYVLRAVPVPAAGLAMPGLTEQVLTVVDGGSGLAKLVAERLTARGAAAEAVESAESLTPDTRGVLLLGGLRRDASVEELLQVQRAAFRAARLVAPRFATEGGVFVTVQDTGGDFGLGGTQGARAWSGGLAALARTAAREWPAAAVKAVDCACSGRTPEDVAEAIAAELLTGGPLLDVGLPAEGGRTTPLPVPAPLAADDGGIPAEGTGPGPDDVIVATGGARGVTAAALLALARARRPRIALLGRTEVDEEPPGLPDTRDEAELVRALAESNPAAAPAELTARARHVLAVREIKAVLAALEDAGAPARYFPADVRDPHALTGALHAVRDAWGPVTGIVHGAGVLADRRIADKTDADFDQVFGTKAEGLRTLLEATAGDPLRTVLLFSSVSATHGNAGQSDYAMANETLAQVASAEAAERPGCHVRSLAWGPWEGGMVTPALAGRFAAAGVPLLSMEAGARACVRELTTADHGSRIVLTAAAGPAAEQPPAPGTALQPAQVRATRHSHPHLADHVIDGTPVLPIAQALEWFTAAAGAWAPAAPQPVLCDLRVLHPAVLDGLDGDGDSFTLHALADPHEPGRLAVELRGAGGRLHYGGTLHTDGGIPVHGDGPANVPDLMPPRDGEHYDGTVLFHGPLLRSLASVDGLGPAGARGTVHGLTGLGWSAGPWHTDPAALDGALQLAVLWALEALKGATLPMAVGAFRLHRPGPARGPLLCEVRPLWAEGAHAQCHVHLSDADGAPFAELHDVELVRRPD